MYSEDAKAKVNLFLDVSARRDDGFHEIISLMHSVELYDTLLFCIYQSDRMEIELTCSDENIPVDERNLVYRAAVKYLERAGINARLVILLNKQIPVGAGLGGGSADAAAMLRGLNKVYKRFDKQELLQLAAELGSDVPFCLLGGTAICTGRGEKMEHLDLTPNLCLVIAKGKASVSTPAAYRALDDKYGNFADGCYMPKLDMLEKLIEQMSNKERKLQLYNIFESVTELGDVEKIKEIMIKNEAECSIMSGSGPAVFGLFPDFNSAARAIHQLEQAGYFASFAYSSEPEVVI